MEKYREGQKELHRVFVDLEKAYQVAPMLATNFGFNSSLLSPH